MMTLAEWYLWSLAYHNATTKAEVIRTLDCKCTEDTLLRRPTVHIPVHLAIASGNFVGAPPINEESPVGAATCIECDTQKIVVDRRTPDHS